MQIRQAAPCDLQQVLDISKASFRPDKDRFGAIWLVDKLAETGVELWVEDAGAGLIRGFAITEKRRTGTTLRYVAVSPEFRRQGVGRRLLAQVRYPAAAWVRSENQASQAMFESSGWQRSIAPRTRRGDWCYFVLPDPAEVAAVKSVNETKRRKRRKS